MIGLFKSFPITAQFPLSKRRLLEKAREKNRFHVNWILKTQGTIQRIFRSRNKRRERGVTLVLSTKYFRNGSIVPDSLRSIVLLIRRI